MLIGQIVLFDLLFLPYFQIIVLPLSLPLVIAGIVGSQEIYIPRRKSVYIVLLFLSMAVSAVLSSFFFSKIIYPVENIKRLFQFITSFFYFFFFYDLAKKNRPKTFNPSLLFIFIAYFLALSFWFIRSPLEVRNMMDMFYGRLVIPAENVSQHFRFAYLFNDPNTAAYFIVIASVPVLLTARSLGVLIGIFAMTSLGVLVTQSRGGLVALAFTALYILRFTRLSCVYKRRYDKMVLGLIIVVVFVAVLFAGNIISHFGSDLIKILKSESRLSDVDAYLSGSSRFDKWERYLTELIPLPFGRGYSFLVTTSTFNPHSDLIRMLYSYGFFAVPLCLLVLFRGVLRNPFLFIPALIAFGINSLIDEQKLFCLFLSIIGVWYGHGFNFAVDADKTKTN